MTPHPPEVLYGKRPRKLDETFQELLYLRLQRHFASTFLGVNLGVTYPPLKTNMTMETSPFSIGSFFSLNSTNRPLKIAPSPKETSLPTIRFQVRFVSFREGKWKKKTSKNSMNFPEIKHDFENCWVSMSFQLSILLFRGCNFHLFVKKSRWIQGTIGFDYNEVRGVNLAKRFKTFSQGKTITKQRKNRAFCKLLEENFVGFCILSFVQVFMEGPMIAMWHTGFFFSKAIWKIVASKWNLEATSLIAGK